MKERPILFSAPMVLSLLDGSKTQTRRVVKHRWEWQIDERDDDSLWPFHPDYVTGEPTISWARCPYGAVGDKLWVRETWQHSDWTEDGMPWIRYAADGAVRFIEGHQVSESWSERLTDRWADLSDPANVAIDGKAADRKWRPSIFMPPWACRIRLEITDVRVQRLQDIDEADAVAEGVYREGKWYRGGTHPVKGSDQYWATPQRAYQAIWETINGAESWALNPWVWALTFRRCAV